jgi:hypothetical protein
MGIPRNKALAVIYDYQKAITPGIGGEYNCAVLPG